MVLTKGQLNELSKEVDFINEELDTLDASNGIEAGRIDYYTSRLDVILNIIETSYNNLIKAERKENRHLYLVKK